jgi:hypothetical protein
VKEQDSAGWTAKQERLAEERELFGQAFEEQSIQLN